MNILYNKININNNKIYLKSYIIRDYINKLIKIYDKQKFIKKEIIIDFDKKLMNINNVILKNYFWKILNYDNLLDYGLDYIIDEIYKKPEIMDDWINYFNIYERFGLNEPNYKWILMTTDKQIGIINIDKIDDKSYIVLNNYKYISKNWWHCIIVKSNKAIGNGIINIDKIYLEEKDIEIDIDWNNLIRNENKVK